MSLIKNTTPLIEVATNRYPVYAGNISAPNYSFGEYIEDSILTELGYSPVTTQDRPPVGQWREIAPVLVDGAYIQTYEEIVKTSEELQEEFEFLKHAKIQELTAVLEQDLTRGAAFDFGATYGVLHIQLRDKDRTNMLGVIKQAELAPTITHSFRAYENVTMELSATELLTAMAYAGQGYVSLMKAFWQVKDAIISTPLNQNLPQIPTSLWV